MRDSVQSRGGPIRSVIGTGLWALAVGCVTSGRNIDFNQVKQLKSGVSMRADAERLFGPPTVAATDGDGVTTCSWTYEVTDGRHVLTSKTLALTFQPDGSYKAIASLSPSPSPAPSPPHYPPAPPPSPPAP